MCASTNLVTAKTVLLCWSQEKLKEKLREVQNIVEPEVSWKHVETDIYIIGQCYKANNMAVM